MIYIQELHEHEFFTEVWKESSAIQRALGIDPLSDGENIPLMDELQFYVVRVGFTLAHTLTWVEQLHQAIHFLSDFSYSKKQKDEGLQRHHHFIYNLENYLIRLQSVYDRLLQLVNNVFHICISDELINHSLIVSNLKVKRTAIPSLLKSVKNTIKDKAAERNQIIHRHSYVDQELRKLELLYKHTQETWPHDENEYSYSDLCHLRRRKMAEVIAKKKIEFQAVNEKLVAALVPLLNELHIQYNKEKKRLVEVI